MMDVERKDDGRWHFALGTVERWIIGVSVSAVFGFTAWSWNTYAANQAKYNENQQELLRATAVTNSKLETISAQMVSIPTLLQATAQMKVQVDRNTVDIRDLQVEYRKRD